MGFFGGLLRLAKGQLVFQPPATPNNPAGNVSPPQPPQTAPQQHALPNVYIERYELNTGSSHMECEFHIHNHSQVPVRLERLEFLGQRYSFNKTYLQPEQEWEYSIHSGSRPTNPVFHECKLYFETEHGDDFVSVHSIEYQQLADRSYTVSHLRFMPPVRDI